MTTPPNGLLQDAVETPPAEEYTTFSRRSQNMITALIGIAMLMSPLAVTIYLPLLPLLSLHFNVSLQSINLTITVYIIFQALSPLILASTSDNFGRRPVYLATCGLFTVSSLGLALNRHSYPALVVLRALQSLGASAMLSMCYGTVSDVCVPARRGKMLGPLMVGANLGTCVGPILGGWIALASGGYEWVFWALCFFGASMFTSMAVLLPETARNVVGNGSIQDRKWNQPLWMVFREFWRCLQGQRKQRLKVRGEKRTSSIAGLGEETRRAKPTRSCHAKSPFAAIRILFNKDTSLIIWLSSSYYALWYCIQATIPTTYVAAPYSFTPLQIGLAYLPGAAGLILSMYLSSKFLDWNYHATAKKAGFTVDKVRGDDLATFPIEKARSRWSEWFILLEMCAVVGYGWAIHTRAHVSVPLILQFLMGLFGTWMTAVFPALLVDTFPEMPSTAATCNNVARSILSATAVGTLQYLIDAMGKGWVFTFLGMLSGVGGLGALIAVRRKGMSWRTARRLSIQR